ncbi:MAG: sulfatase-like hydrolase/transferase [Bryobacteraceae bacterium]
MISRRALLGSAAGAAVLGAQAARRPNVLLFATDQETALLPGPVRVPNRDKLIAEGTRFTHAFCNTPQCSPARAALLTGLYPHNAGVRTNVDGSSLGKALAAGTPTLGSVFAGAGYETAWFGKWHLGPNHTGFQTFLEAGDERAVKAAGDWLGGRSGKPWLCCVSVLDPHHVYDVPGARKPATVELRPGVKAPASGLENLVGKPPEQRAFVDQDQGRLTRDFTKDDWLRYRSYYLGLVEKTDGLLGRVLDAAGPLDNTVVAYTTDHGDMVGEHGLSYKGPFMYDELLRIPLILRVPGKAAFPRGGTRDDLTTQADLGPTLAAAAGVAWPGKVDGRDLARDRKGPDAVFLEYYSKQKWVNPIRTVRTKHWKLNWYDSGQREVYDLEQDPHELRNLAGKAKVEADLARRIDAWWPRG